MFTDYYQSPFGTLKICADHKFIYSVSLINEFTLPANPNSLTEEAKQLLENYFGGHNPDIDPSVFFLKGTSFQKAVWEELLKIPYGATTTYSDIASRIGNPRAVRAVGTAIGKNPLCILVPCHRVLPSTGKVGNYAYGTNMKKSLLILEKESLHME